MMKILKLICGVVLLACAPWLLAEEDLVTLIREGKSTAVRTLRLTQVRHGIIGLSFFGPPNESKYSVCNGG